MKISEMLKSAGRIALVYGEAGAGKTHLSSSFKGKIKIIAAEPNGIQTLEKLPADLLDRIDVELLPHIEGNNKDKSREVFKFFDSFKDVELYKYFVPSVKEKIFQDFTFNKEMPTLSFNEPAYGTYESTPSSKLRFADRVTSMSGKTVPALIIR